MGVGWDGADPNMNASISGQLRASYRVPSSDLPSSGAAEAEPISVTYISPIWNFISLLDAHHDNFT